VKEASTELGIHTSEPPLPKKEEKIGIAVEIVSISVSVVTSVVIITSGLSTVSTSGLHNAVN